MIEKMIEKIKHNKLKTVVIAISSLIFIAGIIIVVTNTKNTYAATYSCYVCYNDSNIKKWGIESPADGSNGCLPSVSGGGWYVSTSITSAEDCSAPVSKCWKCSGGGGSFNYVWSTTADTSRCVIQTEVTSESSCNAVNVYTVKYNANGGTGAPSMQTAQVGESLKLSSTKPTKDGYTFMGWSTNASATVATYKAGSTFENQSV